MTVVPFITAIAITWTLLSLVGVATALWRVRRTRTYANQLAAALEEFPHEIIEEEQEALRLARATTHEALAKVVHQVLMVCVGVLALIDAPRLPGGLSWLVVGLFAGQLVHVADAVVKEVTESLIWRALVAQRRRARALSEQATNGNIQ